MIDRHRGRATVETGMRGVQRGDRADSEMRAAVAAKVGALIVRAVKLAVVSANGVLAIVRHARIDSRATTVRAAHDAILVSAVSALGAGHEAAVVNDLEAATPLVRAVVDFGIVTKDAFRALRVSVRSGVTALTACEMRVVRGATLNDGIPAHRRLD
jgi:hypothetical protein